MSSVLVDESLCHAGTEMGGRSELALFRYFHGAASHGITVYLSAGMAIRVATDLNLHHPTAMKFQSELHEREILNRTRTWMVRRSQID
jgi:hypothetical protein